VRLIAVSDRLGLAVDAPLYPRINSHEPALNTRTTE
jgi:hypothetical protein